MESDNMKFKLVGNQFYEVSSRYGVTDSVHLTPHRGIDLVMESGTKLFSPADGVIEKIVDYGSNNIGKGLMIKTREGETVIMGHMSDTSQVHVGQEVHTGDFVGLSGNTGHSTGAHLHLGLKDSTGSFINPDKYVNNQSVADRFIDNGKINMYHNENLDGKNLFEFLNSWRKDGFFHAMYGKDFFEVTKDFLKELGHDIGMFIVGNSDLFFLLPAILLMFATFIVGRNKYSKYIIPLFFGYFVTSILHKLYM